MQDVPYRFNRFGEDILSVIQKGSAHPLVVCPVLTQLLILCCVNVCIINISSAGLNFPLILFIDVFKIN